MNYLNNPLMQRPLGMFHGGRATNSPRVNLPARNGWAGGGPAYVDAGVPPGQYVDAGTGANGRADNIPAQLSENEYVIDAETVALLGDGNPDEGARKLDEMRAAIRAHKGAALAQGEISEDALPALEYCGGGYTSAMAGGGRVGAMQSLMSKIKGYTSAKPKEPEMAAADMDISKEMVEADRYLQELRRKPKSQRTAQEQRDLQMWGYGDE